MIESTNDTNSLSPQSRMSGCYAPLLHGSLFSGIGGFDLAAEWVGWENAFHCEWNEFGQKILKHYWPNAESYGDIKKTDFTIWRNRIDVLTGGFPCQPYSLAGKRLGKEDDRHLWPQMLRAIREIQPRWIVGENVPGLINWNGGLVFNEVQTDLEAEGYEVQPYVLPACGVNAPHRRERVWIVAYRANTRIEILRSERENTIFTNSTIAYPDRNGHELRGFGEDRQSQGESLGEGGERERIWNDSRGNVQSGVVAHSGSKGLQGSELSGPSGKRNGKEAFRPTPKRFEVPTWDIWPTQFPVRSRNDGFSFRLDGITVPKWRNESIKAYGNAIVPQVAWQIFKAINEYESLHQNL